MQKNKKDIGKIIVYIFGGLTVLSSVFMYINAEKEFYSKWWTLLPLTLGTTILLLNKFKKIN